MRMTQPPSVKTSFPLGGCLRCSTCLQCSGLRLNSSKSEAKWQGKNAHNKETPFDFAWPQRPIVALGTAFSYNVKQCEQEYFGNKLIKVKKLFNLWSQRDFSLYGKITIAKTLGLSKLISSSACLHTPPLLLTL